MARWLAIVALLGLSACKYDLDGVPRRDPDADTKPSHGDDDDAGAMSDEDAGDEPETAVPVCSDDALQCAGRALEACVEGEWVTQSECAGTGCNPVTLECEACDGEVRDDGVLTCALARAQPSGSAVFELDLESRADEHAGSCGGAGSPDALLEWIAPERDYWQLDTLGSTFDTVLYAHGCNCASSELACNDDASGSESEIVLRAERGQRFLVTLDGKAGARGKAVLNARRVTCPAFDLEAGSLPSEFVDDGGDGRQAFRYEAASAGFYSVRVTSDDVPRVGVCLHDGPRCADPLLGCNSAADRYGAEVIRELAEGQVLSLVVMLGDASDGEPRFTLDVRKLEGALCKPAPLDFVSTTAMSIPDASGHLLSSSCAPAGDVRNDSDSRAIGFKEARFVTTVGADEICNLYVNSSFPAVVYALNDDCRGSEVACAPSEMTGTSTPGLEHHADLQLPQRDEARSYLLAIEARGSQYGSGTYEYGIGCIK